MECRRFICKNYVIYVALLTIAVAVMQVWFVNSRLQSFHQYNLEIGHKSVTGVKNQVAFYISEKRRKVELFVNEHLAQIREFANNPDDDKLYDQLGIKLTQHFPDRFAFSVLDNQGIPRFEDFDGLVSQLCLTDIKQFSETQRHYKSYVHPNSHGYHFDIMVRYGEGAKEGIFFVSFLAETLGNIISSIQSTKYQIMLILPQKEDLIEVIAGGARNLLVRDDYHLTETERARITIRHDVEGTRWQVVYFHLDDLHKEYRNKLIIESSIIFMVFVIIALLLVFRLRREEQHREAAENERQILMRMVSHEFRSPVSIIKSALDLIADGHLGQINKDVKEYVNISLDSSSNLMSLVDNFLDLEKIESGHLDFNEHECQLSSMVKNAVISNGFYAEQFNVKYVLQEPLDNDCVICDEIRISQVITNLLTNAAKYGGHEDNIEVSVNRIGKQLRVSVSDHGPGIAKDFQSKVFKKFTMANLPRKNNKIKSSGLGLSIAKAIIDQHGGTIGFDTRTEPESNSGTTFWFELPILL